MFFASLPFHKYLIYCKFKSSFLMVYKSVSGSRFGLSILKSPFTWCFKGCNYIFISGTTNYCLLSRSNGKPKSSAIIYGFSGKKHQGFHFRMQFCFWSIVIFFRLIGFGDYNKCAFQFLPLLFQIARKLHYSSFQVSFFVFFHDIKQLDLAGFFVNISLSTEKILSCAMS
jgi:hypothetical protein